MAPFDTLKYLSLFANKKQKVYECKKSVLAHKKANRSKKKVYESNHSTVSSNNE